MKNWLAYYFSKSISYVKFSFLLIFVWASIGFSFLSAQDYLSVEGERISELISQSDLSDSLFTFTFADYILWVKANHPVSRQAALFPERGEANLRMARGGFDPKLFGTYDDKFFKDINYWRVFEGGLKIPTSLGVEIKTGFEWNDGQFLNSERSIPSQGQAFLGAKIPLGQGLWIDSRRAALQQAKIFTELVEVDRIRMLNTLYFEAAVVYGQWAYAYSNFRLFDRAVNISEERFEAIKRTFYAGDLPGIDTVEALTLLQQFQLQRNEAALDFFHSQLELTNYLWSDEGVPMDLSSQVRPASIQQIISPDEVDLDSLDTILQLLDRHPEIRNLTLTLANLEVERKLKADKLKPRLNLEYTYLSPPNSFTSSEESDETLQINDNYKWGLELDIPIFLRKERGNLALTKLKIQETRFKQDFKRQEIKNKIQSYFLELRVLKDQVILYEDAVANYIRLVNAEEIKFRAGESTLFLINSRQSKQIDAEAKLLEIYNKRFKAGMAFTWINGILWQTL